MKRGKPGVPLEELKRALDFDMREYRMYDRIEDELPRLTPDEQARQKELGRRIRRLRERIERRAD